MAFHLSTLIRLITATSLLPLICSSLEFSYGPLQSSQNLSLFRNASFDTGGVVLTAAARFPDQASVARSIGWLLYNEAIDLLNIESFSTTFTFQIWTNSYGNNGDGLAFIIVPSDSEGPPKGSYGGNLGVVNGTNKGFDPTRHLFAVEFDTFQNAEFHDSSSSHIGIDINTVVSANATDTYDTDLNLYRNSTFTCWVDYSSRAQMVEVRLSKSSRGKPIAPIVSLKYDLSTVFLPSMYIGFSASTGDVYEGHEIFSWSFSTVEARAEPAPAPRAGPLTGWKKQGGGRHFVGAAVRSVLVVTGVIVLAAGVWCCIRGRSLSKSFRMREEEIMPIKDMLHVGPQRYTYKELHKATGGFSEQNFLGRGAYGSVYKGTLGPDRMPVAIKRLAVVAGGGPAGGSRRPAGATARESDFIAEVSTIGNALHRNLVQLRGWCLDKSRQLLVYEYMPNGSLDAHLFLDVEGASGRPPLSWRRRFHVIEGVAAALDYLHEGRQQCIVHRDVKAANVLLDADFSARLGDFGLARLIEHDQLATMTAAGTAGYVAPELPLTGKATDRADVYSFGILCLELVSGRRVLDYSLPPEQAQLLNWAWLMHEKGLLLDVVDPILRGEFLEDQARAVLHIALLCCHPVADARPSMRQVLQILKEKRLVPLAHSRPTISYNQNHGFPLSLDELFQSNSTYKQYTASSSSTSTSSNSSILQDMHSRAYSPR